MPGRNNGDNRKYIILTPQIHTRIVLIHQMVHPDADKNKNQTKA